MAKSLWSSISDLCIDVAPATLDARLLFRVSVDLPWDSIRTAAWRAQLALDAGLLMRLAFAYGEESLPISTQDDDVRLARRNRLIAAAYRARAEELEARETAERLAGSSLYLKNHPEMLEHYEEVACG